MVVGFTVGVYQSFRTMLLHHTWPCLPSLSASCIRILSFARPLCLSCYSTTTIIASKSRVSQMGREKSQLISKKTHFRLCNVSGSKTELVEFQARNPTLQVLFIPGNPGVISFYSDFLESLYEQLGETVSVTGIGYISHSEKDWEHRRLFTLKEQIDHKLLGLGIGISYVHQKAASITWSLGHLPFNSPFVNFIQQELQNVEVPLILVGHSIGAYMSLEIFKRIPEKVAYHLALYPFLTVNPKSRHQSLIKKISGSQLTSGLISAIVALLGSLPSWASRFITKSSMGKSWSATAVDALCTSVLKYHTIRNVLYLAMTEFKELVKVPDWAFMREKQSQIAFLYGVDDHWGPLDILDELLKQVPDAVVEVEREGHTHAFCCTMAGSVWVARYVASVIKKKQILD